MNLQIKTTTSLRGQVTLPASKSQSIRAILLALLAKGKSTVTQVLDSDDTQHAITVASQLGSHISHSNQQLHIKSTGVPLIPMTDCLNSGNSGITTLFTLPLLGLRKNYDQPITLDCGDQMRLRPVTPIIDPLLKLGLKIQHLKNPNTLPVQISGKLIGGQVEVSGSTSQYLSSLLIALPCAEKESHITVKDLCERPYMEMTLKWLDAQGIQYTHQTLNNVDHFTIPGQQQYQAFKTPISGDFSSASYLIAASALIPGTVELNGLDMNEPQGDKRLVSILQEMGADIKIEAHCLEIHGGKPLKGIFIDASDIPDLLPTLAVIGTVASGKTEIRHVAHARIKETDRIHSMLDGLTRLGAQVIEHEDGMTIYESQLHGTQVNGYGDHRTVMALSIAGMMAKGTTLIEGMEAIHKTFPTFLDLMKSLGAHMEGLSCS